MTYFLSLLADGVLSGAIYGVIALAFVVVYKASRVVNFALGEWAMFGSRLTAAGWHGAGLGLACGLAAAMAGMVALALVFNRLVLARLIGRPLIALVMVTLGLGALMRGLAPVLFAGIPAEIPLPIPVAMLELGVLVVATDKLAAACIAAICIAAVAWFFQASRTGLAMRAIADDAGAAMAAGIDIRRHYGIAWAMAGLLCVIGGTLWTFVTGGGFGVALVGLKVFPIVILGGLANVPGCILSAILIGALEALATGYLDPHLGGGFGGVASYLVLIAVLILRPHGLLGRPAAERV
ncbi:branched-chain amino acid ABC transporter permease [Desertibaculum subflavum]|uniref:branched-chain amino acid ABC transporter permease n=1 Tax=Desertibaculum subflavum TaxID=2268458 RepID=UPI000E671ECB